MPGHLGLHIWPPSTAARGLQPHSQSGEDRGDPTTSAPARAVPQGLTGTANTRRLRAWEGPEQNPRALVSPGQAQPFQALQGQAWVSPTCPRPTQHQCQLPQAELRAANPDHSCMASCGDPRNPGGHKRQ